MATVHFYTRRGCHLCEIMLEQVMPLLRGRADIELRDVDTDAQWREIYDTRVPVLEYQGTVISDYPLDQLAVERLVAEMPENGAEIGILRR